MTLPKIQLPTYDLHLPSDGREIKVRPFLVKEEKLLLMALESKDNLEIINTTKQIINNCIISKGIRIDSLPFFDIDYLFIALRAKSVGEDVDIKFTCNSRTENGYCVAQFNAKIDIANCKVVKDEKIEQNIPIAPNVSVRMKYPSYAAVKMIYEDGNTMDKKIDLIMASIEYIQEREKVTTLKDMTKEELREFVEGLTSQQFKKLEHFVDNFPTFVITSEAKCDSCGTVHNLEYKDFTRFFV
jgi:T4 bacteriophage base plate protein